MSRKPEQETSRRRISESVDRVRATRAKQGHELTLMQEAIVSCVAAYDPKYEPWSKKTLALIREAVDQKGIWTEQDEWRISTWFETKIAKIVRNGTDRYQVAVECDRQTLSCECPSVEKALAFMWLYKRFVIDQFYSVGPPWAENHVFES